MQDQQSINIEIISYQYEGTTVFYQISVKFGIKQWNVQKRYSQFEDLNRALELTFQQLPQLPKKNFLTFIVGKSVEQINERKCGLQRYLQKLASRKEILEHEVFQSFLRLKQPEQMIKDNINEHIENPLKIQQEINDIQNDQPNPQQILIKIRDQEQQTSFIEIDVSKEEQQADKQFENLLSLEKTEKESNNKEELIQQMKTQLKELYDQIYEKDQIITNFNKRELETQEYYNEQIYEKQYRINELNTLLNQYQESQSVLQKQYEDLQNINEDLKIKLQQSLQQSEQLQQQLNQNQNFIQQQFTSLGYENLNEAQLQQIIIEQQRNIEEQIQTNKGKELEFKQELENYYLVEAQRDELFQENQLLKTQLEEELLHRNEQTENIEQLKQELEQLQIQLNEKQDIKEIKNELS